MYIQKKYIRYRIYKLGNIITHILLRIIVVSVVFELVIRFLPLLLSQATNHEGDKNDEQ